MIVGLGMDIVEITRIAKAVGNRRFVERVYTEGERLYCEGKRQPAAAFAVRFAAKEAFLKALGVGLAQGITWHDVEVCRDDNGKPTLKVTGRAGEMLRERRIDRIHVTLTHARDTAAATVILEAETHV